MKLPRHASTAPQLPIGIDWRLGEWQRQMRDVTGDVLLADTPYGKRTHEGYRSGSDASDESGIDNYAHWTPDHVMEFVRFWHERIGGWMCTLTSHDLVPAWERAYEEAGRLAFVPLPCLEQSAPPHAAPCAVVPAVIRGMGVRLQGDGPANWTQQLIVARPRSLDYSRWVKEHGKPEEHYIGPAVRGSKKGRGKPDWLLRAILRDYSEAGNIVIDPTGGWATTGVAAAAMGRQFVGCEVDEEAFLKGLQALMRVEVADLFDSRRSVQAPLFAGAPIGAPLAKSSSKRASRREVALTKEATR